MVEAGKTLAYYQRMSQSETNKIASRQWQSLVQSLDVRTRPEASSLRPGQSVHEAWAATGIYLRQALDNYGKQSSQTHSDHQSD